jgi:Peptidase S46
MFTSKVFNFCKQSQNYKGLVVFLFCGVLLIANGAFADEGMWKYSKIPHNQIKAKYKVSFGLNQLAKFRRASVRVDNICSGALVSSNGLVQTNSHCIVDIYNQKDEFGKSLFQDGFLAKTKSQEVKLRDFEISYIESTHFLEKNSPEFSKICPNISKDYFCEIIQDSKSDNIRIDKYAISRDIRLVFAPEFMVGNFGFINDNFNFPRYSVDVAFLRIYGPNNKPLQSKDYFTWREIMPKAYEPVFTSGYPGFSRRNLSSENINYEISTRFKAVKLNYQEQMSLLQENGAINDIANFFIVKNSYDVLEAVEKAHENGSLKQAKMQEEAKIKDYLARNKNSYLSNFDPYQSSRDFKVTEASSRLQNSLIGEALFMNSELARNIWQNYSAKTDTNHDIYDGEKSFLDKNQERIAIKAWVNVLRKNITSNDDSIAQYLKDYSSDEIADAFINSCGTDLKLLNDIHSEIFKTCRNDKLVSKTILGIANPALLKSGISELENFAYNKISNRIALAKARAFPNQYDYEDANGTLRFSYGQILPQKNQTKYFSTISGIFVDKNDNQDRKLSTKWQLAKDKLNYNLSANFVSTNDVVGGNSGSPIFDKTGGIIGSVFDGNAISAANLYYYHDDMRTISVSNAIIGDVLHKIYNAEELLGELRNQIKK